MTILIIECLRYKITKCYSNLTIIQLICQIKNHKLMSVFKTLNFKKKNLKLLIRNTEEKQKL